MEALCTVNYFLHYPHKNAIIPSQSQRSSATIGCTRRQGVRNGQVWMPLRVAAKEATMAPSPSSSMEGTDNDSYDCVVVGGGISGLTTALALATKHSSTLNKLLLTEATDRVGGNIITMEKDGYLCEEGPNSFQPSDSMLSLLVFSFLPYPFLNYKHTHYNALSLYGISGVSVMNPTQQLPMTTTRARGPALFFTTNTHIAMHCYFT
ncbi:hypothetical protein KI387_026918, partial [Taxus chinensis]